MAAIAPHNNVTSQAPPDNNPESSQVNTMESCARSPEVEQEQEEDEQEEDEQEEETGRAGGRTGMGGWACNPSVLRFGQISGIRPSAIADRGNGPRI